MTVRSIWRGPAGAAGAAAARQHGPMSLPYVQDKERARAASERLAEPGSDGRLSRLLPWMWAQSRNPVVWTRVASARREAQENFEQACVTHVCVEPI